MTKIEITRNESVTLNASINNKITVGVKHNKEISDKPWVYITTACSVVTIDVEDWDNTKQAIDACLKEYENARS